MLHALQVLQSERPSMKGPQGRKLSLEMAHVMVKEVDADMDGNVSYEDFRKMWNIPAVPVAPGAAVVA